MLMLLFLQGHIPVKENKEATLAYLEAKLRRSLINHDRHEEIYLQNFCDALVMDNMPDSAKVKVFTDWICEYLTYDKRLQTHMKRGYLPRRPINWQTAILDKMTVCAGYADLLRVMCETQGIDCKVVTGKAYSLGKVKRATSVMDSYTPGNFEMFFERHAWNLVTYESGRSYLVDPTWIDGEKSYYYFQTDPFEFLRDHLPDIPAYQLIEEPVTQEELCTLKMSKIRKMHELRTCLPCDQKQSI